MVQVCEGVCGGGRGQGRNSRETMMAKKGDYRRERSWQDDQTNISFAVFSEYQAEKTVCSVEKHVWVTQGPWGYFCRSPDDAIHKAHGGDPVLACFLSVSRELFYFYKFKWQAPRLQ